MPIELIGVDRVDLGWLKKVHIPDVDMPGPVQIIDGHADVGGRIVRVEHTHTLAHGDGVALVHRGSLDGLPIMPAANVLEWAVRTFFDDESLIRMGGVKEATIDGLRRWCDIPPPVKKTCSRCKGLRRDPNAKERDDGLVATCLRCDGNGTEFDDSGLDKIGPVLIDRRVLAPVLAELRGNDVALCWSPAVNGIAMEAHIRAHVKRTSETKMHLAWGDWRIMMPGVMTPP